MQVKGEHSFSISKERLWDYLMDPEVLAKITPGVSKLKPLGDDTYQTVSDIKIGPVKGNFKGKLKVVDKNHPNDFAIEMEQLSKIGNAHARIEMKLGDGAAGGSALQFDGKANLSGVIARTGQRVLSGVANSLSREVFKALEKHIEEDTDPAPQAEVAAIIPAPEQVKVEESISPQADVTATTDNSLWGGIVRFFKNLFN